MNDPKKMTTKDLFEACFGYPPGSSGLDAAIQLRSRIDRLEKVREVLSFYGNKENWRQDTVDIGIGGQSIPYTSEIEVDGGKKAVEALSACDWPVERKEK